MISFLFTFKTVAHKNTPTALTSYGGLARAPGEIAELFRNLEESPDWRC